MTRKYSSKDPLQACIQQTEAFYKVFQFVTL